MNNQNQTPINTFASLLWYDETIKFVFNFVAKTSELLLAAGVVISSANFLTDGAIMQDHSPLSFAWAWAQALAIDSSLGIVFVNGFQAAREHDKIKATIYFTLTAMLATVAGLLTHFDALSHATGLAVTDRSISGVIPLWMLTALRAIAVIGFLLVSRLKNIHFNQPQENTQELANEPAAAPQLASIDYALLATAIVEAMQQRGKIKSISVFNEETTLLPPLQLATTQPEPEKATITKATRERNQEDEIEVTARIALAYQEIKAEREATEDKKTISARDLASRARVRRSTCSTWLETHGTRQEGADSQEKGEEACTTK